MLTAAENLGMIRTPRRNNQPPWFNGECRSKRALLRAAFRRRRRNAFDQQSLHELADARRQFADALKSAQLEHDQFLLSQIAKSNSAFDLWSAIGKINQIKANPSSQLSIEAVTCHFSSLFNKFPRCESIHFPLQNPVPNLDNPISLRELESVIKLLKRNKAPGPDGLGNDFYKSMNTHNRECLLSLFNHILSTSSCPLSWGEINITLIHKKGSTSDPSNYRGISLMNSITKLFTAIITARLATWADDQHLIPEIQSGFRKHRGCTDNIFVLASLIAEKTSPPGGKLYAAFIDFKQAFDAVNHQILFQKLAWMGVSPRLINTIRSFYSVAQARVSLPHGDTERIPILNGVLQGDTLSPLLFSLFVHDVETFIRSNYPNARGVSLNHAQSILGLLYADDFVLFGADRVQLNILLKALNDYALRNELVVNTLKSKVMVFRKGGYLARGTRFLLGNAELEIVNRYQYLGVWFSSFGSFSGHAIETAYKAERAGAAVRVLLSRVGNYSSETANTLTAAKVTSTLLHAAEIWALDHINILQLPILRFHKKLFHLPLSTPHHIICQEFPIPSMEAIVHSRSLSWLGKVALMSADRIPRICVDHQVDLLLRGNSYPSWLSRILQCLLDAGIRFDLSQWQQTDFKSLKKLLFDSDTRHEFNHTLVRSLNSSHCPMYRCLTRRSHFVRDENLSSLRLFLQLQLTNDTAPRLLWGGMRTRFSPNSPCPLCNTGSPDSVAHFVLDCPVLAGYRPRSLSNFATFQGSEHIRLAAVLNTRSAHLDLLVFIPMAIRVRNLADVE